MFKRIASIYNDNKSMMVVLGVILVADITLQFIAGLSFASGCAAFLRAIGNHLLILLAVPIVLKLWFWSGMNEMFLSALGVQRSLHHLGILQTEDSQDQLSGLIEVQENASFTLVAVAGLPLSSDRIRSALQKLSKCRGAKINICMRSPDTIHDNMFQSSSLLRGHLAESLKFLKELEETKDATCTLKIGFVSPDMKYTLLLGEARGAYMPHPFRQDRNMSPQMKWIVFDKSGDFYTGFLRPDVDHIVEVMKSSDQTMDRLDEVKAHADGAQSTISTR